MKQPVKVKGTGIYRGTVKHWDSIADCARAFGVTGKTVSTHIKKKEELNGYILERVPGNTD